MNSTAPNPAGLFQWTHTHLVHVLSTGRDPIVTDPLLLNAFRQIDRADFLPDKVKAHESDEIYKDRLFEIGYSEVTTNPTLVARQLQILNPRLGGVYLHLGAGTGYVSSLLGAAVGKRGHVYALERVQWLWEQARVNARKYEQLSNTEILYRNGREGLPDKSPFDGILYSYIPDVIDDSILHQLRFGGKIVAPQEDHSLKIFERIEGEDEFIEETIFGFSSYNYGDDHAGLA